MRRFWHSLILAILIILIVAAAFALDRYNNNRTGKTTSAVRLVVLRNMPHPTDAMLAYSIWRTAPFEVAKVFGRSPGCANATSELIEETAKAAIDTNVDPAILAATIATESSCNQYAVSSRGAVGRMQIMVRIWASKFDFGHDVNLFNSADNIHTGAVIMADSINRYGLQAGIQRYNGVGVGCDSCDGGYATRIMALAGRR